MIYWRNRNDWIVWTDLWISSVYKWKARTCGVKREVNDSLLEYILFKYREWHWGIMMSEMSAVSNLGKGANRQNDYDKGNLWSLIVVSWNCEIWEDIKGIILFYLSYLRVRCSTVHVVCVQGTMVGEWWV